MIRSSATQRVVTTLKRYGPSPARLIASKARCKVATVQATLNKLVYSGLLSFAEMRLGKFARPRARFGNERLLRIYYIPRLHSSNRIYSAIKRLIVFKRPSDSYERRAFGMWLSSSILPGQVKETIQTTIYESRRRQARARTSIS
ncbi:MAG: hypothetical protein RMJ28_05490 [Nitrososphaerota archaeon]|nr:hypothetical protein [Candidatus Calditenuaceae archaeon]MDW8073667.1 hypothetical protein [Nitrososphaerota archaeon]